MERDLDKINELAHFAEDENWHFRSYLMNADIPSERIDALVAEIYEEVTSAIDCATCGNCCRHISIILDDADIAILSRKTGEAGKTFRAKYIEVEPDTERLLFRGKPCPFLSETLCTQYAERPLFCREFPPFLEPHVTERLEDLLAVIHICPIVFNVYEKMKEHLWFSKMFEGHL